jgi:hypothetical protein
MAHQAAERTCRLAGTLGRSEPCPERRCAFWEPGGAVLDGRCAFDEIAGTTTRDAAERLLEIRSRLESAGTGEERDEARRLFAHMLAEGREE